MTPQTDPTPADTLLSDAQALLPELQKVRRDIHAHPEIGLDLPRTQGVVLEHLEGLGYEVTTGKGLSSVTAVLRGGRRGEGAPPTVLLRGDMDALPIQEQTGLPFSSTIDGAMHACGHDFHTTMLLGAARLLSERVDELHGDIVLMFQPGEEGRNGGSLMIKEGVLDAAGQRPDAAYALHVMNNLGRRGQLLSRTGATLSASSGLFVTLKGEGGHGSTPEKALDPVPALAEIITGMQTLITRRFSIFDPVVLSVGVVSVEGARNTIAETAHFEATLRYYSEESSQRLEQLIPEYIRSVAAGHGIEADIRLEREYLVTQSDETENAHAVALLTELFGPESERLTPLPSPLSSSEDFSFVLHEIPGAFIFLDTTPDPGATTHPDAFNHSPFVVFDDSVLGDGAAALAHLAIGRLAELSAAREGAAS